jgi:hypothetical protein
LASILLVEDERNFAYLIAKNQEREIDHGLLRTINGFVCSVEEKNTLTCRLLQIMQYLSEEGASDVNTLNILNAPNVSKVLIKILTEEKKNKEIIIRCHDLIHQMITNNFEEYVTRDYQQSVEIAQKKFLKYEIIEALMSSVEPFLSIYGNSLIGGNVLDIFSYLAEDYNNIPRLKTAGLLKVLIQVFNSPHYEQEYFRYVVRSHKTIIGKLCAFDMNIPQQFHELGIPEESSFFGQYIP